MAVQQTTSTQSRLARKNRKRSVGMRFFLYTILSFVLLSILSLCWFFLTASGTTVRLMMADTLITTQHRDWAKYLIGSEELQKRVEAYWKQFDEMGDEKDKGIVQIEPVSSTAPAAAVKKELVTIEPISGTNFKGQLVTISDPKKLRIAVPEKVGKGEKVSSMVKRTGAILGVNGGGFIDPNWEGNGFQPEGIVMSGGKIFYNDKGMNGTVQVVGIDKEGRMIAGKYKVSELVAMGVQEAVSFSPRFIVNGVGQIKSQADGWGIAPRTSMAQTKDGSILFAVIDGRQTHSIGATLYDIQEIFLAHGAVTAANLDGGASTVLVHNNAIINKPSSEYGERYLPTAWLVFEHPETAPIKNVWEGLDIRKIDPSKW
ncbi:MULTISPECIES: phosphodiester glycosidase family protein [Paenibacillus]|uniref:Phosphodiester glycosidase family protein n=1 Tax=Paenibacillus violae TaxID=3077234 RepID=A0ABU3RK45_9BACL|nr:MULTISPECIES: phosphodiester glycosidase family protein [Paenibacillus]MDU0204207.1 phosphodiester glycosidase family protein [Paenibacillus sp. PFR10]MEC0266500.1 phosphodiester glycosidase family protein [Paenibacillus anseongense]